MKHTKFIAFLIPTLFLTAAPAYADDHAEAESPVIAEEGRDAMRKNHERRRVHHERRMDRYLGKQVDTNQDGEISYDEFIANAQSRFEATDLDGNGSITKEERKQAAEIMREKHREAMKAARKAHKEAMESR